MNRLLLVLLLCFASVLSASDPLPSWNEGRAKTAILEFVKATTEAGSSDYIPMAERIAVFDQDGTLWVEHPVFTQFQFAIDRVKELAKQNPLLAKQEPYKRFLENTEEAIRSLTKEDIAKILGLAHSGMTTEAYDTIVSEWLNTAVHPRFRKPFTQLIYKPMLEVIRLFRDNGYTVYIVSGGGQEFIRVYAEEVYGIPPQQIIGTPTKVRYEYLPNGDPALFKLADVLFIDDKEGKPEGINLFIGRHPAAAFGNSTGDQQMLEWTQARKGKTLEMLVHHDDPVREYAYGPDTRVGTFSEALMTEAKERGWIVISMKDDWRVVFPVQN